MSPRRFERIFSACAPPPCVQAWPVPLQLSCRLARWRGCQCHLAVGSTTAIVAWVIAEPLLAVQGAGAGRAGDSGGATELHHAPAEGCILGTATVSTTAASSAGNKKSSFNSLTDFTPIINTAAVPNIIAVRPSFPARNHQRFAAALASPRQTPVCIVRHRPSADSAV